MFLSNGATRIFCGVQVTILGVAGSVMVFSHAYLGNTAEPEWRNMRRNDVGHYSTPVNLLR